MPNDTIEGLITTLQGKDGSARKRAREQLLEIGSPVVPALLPLLSDKRTQTRWEAAKVLSELGDPGAAPALVTALEDNDPGIRWMAAEGLIGAEHGGLRPLLEAVLDRGGSVRVREGADHVLKVLARDEKLPAAVAPVLEALHGPSPSTSAPEAAKRALETLAG